MKYAVLIGDGMADYPLKELDNLTPLEAANTPNMDNIVREGQLGSARMVPHGFTPGSDVAILSILGYDPEQYYTGRAPLEAANLGIELGPEDIAFRCNLITTKNERIADYSSGHISDSEAKVLIEFIDQHLGTQYIRFYPGVGYRHICVIENRDLYQIECTPPHDVLGQLVEKNLPKGTGAQQLVDLIEHSYELLSNHDVNKARIDRGQNTANMIWLWGQGFYPDMPTFKERFGISGGVISAVDLVKGLAKLTCLDCIEVPGATGYYDTNYKAKADYALKRLEQDDFILVHVEAPDEAGHNAELGEKIKAIENFDNFIVGPVKKWLDEYGDFRILVLPDHFTPIELRTHTADPIPFAWYGRGILKDEAESFSEKNSAKSDLKLDSGCQLMERFIKSQTC